MVKLIQTRPLYLQVRDLLLRRISSGEWQPGEALPNEYRLATDWNVSVGTVRKAMDELVSEWVVTRRQGRGTFVNDQGSAVASLRYSNFRNRQVKSIEGAITASNTECSVCSEEEAMRLAISRDESVLRVNRIRANNRQPFLVETCILPASLYQVILGDLGNYRISELAQQNGLHLGNAEETIDSRRASAEDAQALGVAIGEPLLVLNRVVRSIDGRAVEWRNARFKSQDVEYCARFVP